MLFMLDLFSFVDIFTVVIIIINTIINIIIIAVNTNNSVNAEPDGWGLIIWYSVFLDVSGPEGANNKIIKDIN